MALRRGAHHIVTLVTLVTRLSVADSAEDLLPAQFRADVDEALGRLRDILQEERQPRFPADVAHHYEDKFLLVELSTQAAAASLVELLSLATQSSSDWTQPAGLRFKLCSSYTFLKTEEKDVQVGTAQVQESESVLGNWRSTVRNTVKVTEHLWNHSSHWHLNDTQGTLLHGFTGELLKTLGDRSQNAQNAPTAPAPSSCETEELSMRWLRDGVHFAVNRSSPDCRTPSVNLQTQAALDFFGQLETFAGKSEETLLRHMTSGEAQVLPQLQGKVFKPVLALFAMENASKAVLTADLPMVLSFYRRSLAEKLEENDRMFGAKVETSLIRLSLLLAEMKSLARQMLSSVKALEGLLHQQLTAALGKQIRSRDFSEYMDFHGRLILGEGFAPEPFVYDVRRPDHHPEGTISIESGFVSMPSAIRTFTLHRREAPTMRVQLNSAATVTLQGEHFVHAAIFHRFAREPEQELRLVARARQLSSFVLMVGKIAAADRFEPSAALIIQNKDDLVIPLLLETVPTPKEFIDSIQSLSPEQQRFAQAFRKMQLSSSLFAVAVVQIKPLLEKVLNLPEFSLTKEIQLTQDLIELFVRYQVPPDLMSYDEAHGSRPEKLNRVSTAEKLKQVKDHVEALWQTIAASKSKQLKETQEEAKMRNMQKCGAEECPNIVPMSRGARGAGDAEHAEMRPRKLATDLATNYQEVSYSGNLRAEVMMSAEPVKKAKTMVQRQPQEYRLLQMEQQNPSEDFVKVDGKQPNPAETSRLPPDSQVSPGSWDYTQIPHELDANYLKFDTDAKLRPSNIKVGTELWQKQEQRGFLGEVKKRTLDTAEQRRETNQAYDLLDALSRSGALVLESTSLHVVLAATHCFDETIINTAIKENQNPIEKLERSMMIVASTVHRSPPQRLASPAQVQRMRELSPALFAESVSKGVFPR